jgi:hypothetical protein
MREVTENAIKKLKNMSDAEFEGREFYAVE